MQKTVELVTGVVPTVIHGNRLVSEAHEWRLLTQPCRKGKHCKAKTRDEIERLHVRQLLKPASRQPHASLTLWGQSETFLCCTTCEAQPDR